MRNSIEKLLQKKYSQIDELANKQKEQIEFVLRIINENFPYLEDFFVGADNKKNSLEEIYQATFEAIQSVNYYKDFDGSISHQGKLDDLKSPFSELKNPAVLLKWLDAKPFEKGKFSDLIYSFSPTEEGLKVYRDYHK